MCDTLHLVDSREIDAAGRARLAQLQAWIQADLERGDASLSRALECWRSDVVCRISSDRPQVVRIPNIFVSHLKLPGQRVVIGKGNEVYLLVSRMGAPEPPPSRVRACDRVHACVLLSL